MDGGVGARLREARVQRGLDLAEVEAATKIQARFLSAIENEEWSRLPGEFYARSFIRAYAAHLGLDDVKAAELRGASSPDAAAERLPRVDPAPPQEAHAVRRHRRSPRLLAAIGAVALAAVVAAAMLSDHAGDSSGPARTADGGGAHQQGTPSAPTPSPERRAGASLTLAATAEVWVCLLDRRGRPLIDGQILEPGAEAGPYRSGSYTVSLGNGSIEMAVGGRPVDVPPTASPIGFAIDRNGELRQLSEGERPTCA
jgi:transcriptional regulator with XRE-family HTH domain